MLSSKLLNKDDILCEKPEFLKYNEFTDIRIKSLGIEKIFEKKEFDVKEFFVNQDYTLCTFIFSVEKIISKEFKEILKRYYYNQENINVDLRCYNSTTNKDTYIDFEKNNLKIEFQCSPTEITLLVLIPNNLLK